MIMSDKPKGSQVNHGNQVAPEMHGSRVLHESDESQMSHESQKSQENCIFCDIVAGRRDAHVVYEDDLTQCILDINPWSRGHCLVIPRRHVQWWHEMTDEENASVFRVAGIVARKMMLSLKPDFVCMYARGRRIAHTHIFLVPTYSGDVLDRFFSALEQFQESPANLAGLKSEGSLQEASELIRNA